MTSTRQISIVGRNRTITGLSVDDPYFAAISDDTERPFWEFCSKHIRPGSLCWDVGCNIGVTSLVMANTNPTGPIFAIDANRSVLDLHRRNMTANGATNVTSVHGALGDRDGETRFLENSAFGIVYSQGVPVRMLSPDALIAMGGGVPDFVKMDVEGYEPIILRAAAEHFVKNGTLVHFELNTWCLLAYSRVQPLDFLEWVCDQFTHCYRLDANGADLTRFSRDECTGLLLSNLTQQPYTFLDNIVVTSDADRLANA